jgi:hypothetical protein
VIIEFKKHGSKIRSGLLYSTLPCHSFREDQRTDMTRKALKAGTIDKQPIDIEFLNRTKMLCWVMKKVCESVHV